MSEPVLDTGEQIAKYLLESELVDQVRLQSILSTANCSIIATDPITFKKIGKSESVFIRRLLILLVLSINDKGLPCSELHKELVTKYKKICGNVTLDMVKTDIKVLRFYQFLSTEKKQGTKGIIFDYAVQAFPQALVDGLKFAIN